MAKRFAFLSDKKNLIRTILFFLALIVAIVGITNGVVQYGRKEPGYYTVELKSESHAVVYDSGVSFLYYAQGDSDAIKQRLNQASEAYSQSLERAYKLLDASAEYEGYVNIATLNRRAGSELPISEELYAVLADALGKTDGGAYSVFAGAPYSMWRDILYLEDPTDFDPRNNEDIASRLTALAESACSGGFTLTLTDEDTRTARFAYTPESKAFLEEYEVDAPILDLNVLHDAYLLQLVAADMEAQGFDSGYLYADSGVSIMLNRDDMQYGVFSCAERAVTRIANIPALPHTVFCQMAAFPLTENPYGYYAIEADGMALYRHPWIDARTGLCSEKLLSACAAATGVTPADAMYALLNAVYAGDEEATRSSLKNLGEAYTVAAYCTQDAPYALHVCGERPELLAISEDARFSALVY